MEHGAVRLCAASKVMPLDDAGKSVAFAGSQNVHLVVGLENLVDQDLVPTFSGVSPSSA